MTSRLAQGAQSQGYARWLGGAFLIGAAVIVAWILVTVLVNGPQARAMIERQNAEEIVQENRAFCGKLGIVSNTQTFDTCVYELAQVRRGHEERLFRDVSSF